MSAVVISIPAEMFRQAQHDNGRRLSVQSEGCCGLLAASRNDAWLAIYRFFFAVYLAGVSAILAGCTGGSSRMKDHETSAISPVS